MIEEEYSTEVESTALTILEKIEEYPEDYGDDEWKAIHEEVDRHEYVLKNHLFLDVLQHSERGPEEWHIYVDDGEKNHWEVLGAMAYTSFRGDVFEQVQQIREVREDLGEAIQLIDGAIYAERVKLHYKYETYSEDDDEIVYRFECLGESEWRVLDPDNVSFEVISPRVMIEQDDGIVPEKILKRKLDDLCAKQEHKRE